MASLPVRRRFLDGAEEHLAHQRQHVPGAQQYAGAPRLASRSPALLYPEVVHARQDQHSPRKPFSPGRPTLDKVINTMNTASSSAAPPMPP